MLPDTMCSAREEPRYSVAGGQIAPADQPAIHIHDFGLIAARPVENVEAVKPLFEKEIDGFSVIFHQISYQKIETSTIQSRACACVAKGTYIFALPGSPGAVKDGWDGILKSQLDSRFRPCNFVELMPRLRES